MKKAISVVLASVITFTAAFSTFAAEGKIINGKTMVPVRGVFEELGFNVEWNNETETAVISDGTYTVEVPKGKNYFMVNGVSVKPDVPQQVINGSLYLPLRAIGDAVGAATSWDSENKMAHINYMGSDSYVKCGLTAPKAVSSPAVTYPAVKSQSPITDVSAQLYNDVKNFIYSDINSLEWGEFYYGLTADEIEKNFNNFRSRATNSKEDFFVTATFLIYITYKDVFSVTTLVADKLYGVADSSELAAAVESTRALADAVMDGLWSYSGDVLGLSIYKNSMEEISNDMHGVLDGM